MCRKRPKKFEEFKEQKKFSEKEENNNKKKQLMKNFLRVEKIDKE